MRPNAMNMPLNNHSSHPWSITPRIDPVNAAEEILSGVFCSLFPDEEARKKFGYHQISQCVNGEGLPGWYLWFRKTKGAFQLLTIGVIAPADQESVYTGKTAVDVEMMIRYYPAPEEKVFERFSSFEKLVRLGPLFDHTGTPTFEGAARIHESQFIAGYLNVRINPSRSYLELECRAPQRWTDYRTDGLYFVDEGHREVEVVPPGGKDRYVPGWNLSWRFYDKILLGFGYIFKITPAAVFLSREDGFAFFIDGKNRVKQNRDLKSSSLRVTTCFALPSVPTANYSVEERLHQTRARLRAGKSKLTEINCMPTRKVPWINPDWWRVKDMTFCATRVCHCCSHDH